MGGTGLAGKDIWAQPGQVPVVPMLAEVGAGQAQASQDQVAFVGGS